MDNASIRSPQLPERSVPLCLQCLEPHDPLLHYCPKCTAAVGQLTPLIPFVNISYQCEFWSRLWHKLWSPRPGHYAMRLAAILLILQFTPIMLLGIPFVLLARGRTNRRGFPVTLDDQQPAPAETPPPPDAADPDQPSYSNRPGFMPRK